MEEIEPRESCQLAKADFLLIVAILGEAFFTGVFAILVGFIVWVLVTTRRSMSTTHKILFGSSIMMFLIAVGHLALLVQHVAIGKVLRPAGRAARSLALAQVLFSDSILIWRVWVIWGRNYWVIVTPALLLLSALGFLLFTIVDYRYILPKLSVPPTVLITANTCICMALIIFRVWWMNPRSTSSRDVRRGVMLFIESGALYAATQVIILILYFTRSPGLSIMLDIEIPLIGILPSLILVVVYFKNVPGTKEQTSTQRSTWRANKPFEVTLNSVQLENVQSSSQTKV